MTIHAGAMTALELQGLSHYVPLGEHRRVVLLSDEQEQIPAWFRKRKWDAAIEYKHISLFKVIPPAAVVKSDCGGFDIFISSPERDIMEQIYLSRQNEDIEHVSQLMEGLTTLRPELIQNLLENCRSVKVKRFFLWSAENVGQTWFKRLDSSRIDLGKGKRQIYKGGQFNQRYQITVPKQGDFPGV
jgi:hypothetical protein